MLDLRDEIGTDELGVRRPSDLPRDKDEPAFGGYRWDRRTGFYEPGFLHVLSLRGAHIREITSFSSPEVLAGFGSPRRLRGS